MDGKSGVNPELCRNCNLRFYLGEVRMPSASKLIIWNNKLYLRVKGMGLLIYNNQ